MNIDPFRNQILVGHALETLKQIPDNSIQCAVTSPPYWAVRAYKTSHQIWDGKSDCVHDFQANFCVKCGSWAGELGHEPSPHDYIRHLVQICSEVRRVLRPDGIFYCNIAATWAGGGQGPTGKNGIGNQEKRQGYDHGLDKTKLADFPPKNMIPTPWMLGIALQQDGWILRSEIIWRKFNPMPASYRDRCTVSHEYVLMLTKNPRYYFDDVAIQEPCTTSDRARNRRSVWEINTQRCHKEHYAAWPPKLAELMILSGSPEKGSCAECGAPYARAIGKEAVYRKANDRSDKTKNGVIYHTKGWEKTCKCATTETRPAVILDFFGGSGTSGMVAKALNRDYVLCELNPTYVEIAKQRIAEGYSPKKEKKSKRQKPADSEGNKQLELKFE